MLHVNRTHGSKDHFGTDRVTGKQISKCTKDPYLENTASKHGIFAIRFRIINKEIRNRFFRNSGLCKIQNIYKITPPRQI